MKLLDLFGYIPGGRPAEDEYDRVVVLEMLRDPYIEQKDIVSRTGLEQSIVSRRYNAWKPEIRVTLRCAQDLGISNTTLYMAALTGIYRSSVFEELKAVREDRAQADVYLGMHAVEFRATVEDLWFEFRVAKGYHGLALDTFPVVPPKWFVEDELGLKL